MNKKQITYLIIFIAVFLIAIAGATYAFFEFGGVTIDGDLPLNTMAGSSATFTAYSEGNISLDVNKTVMSKDVSSNVAASTDNSIIHVKLEGGAGTSSTTCTYDLIWVWDSAEQYKTSTVELPYTHTDGVVYPYEFSVKIGIKETNLSDFTWNENKAVIATKSISALSGETKTDDYDVIVNFYNLPIRQNDLSGKLYQGHIEVSEARCNANPTIAVVAKEGDNLSSSIKKLYTKQGVEVGNGKLYLHDSTLENGAGDNSYRYSGADPDNYLCFQGDTCDDDHKYRIIGIFGDNIKVIKMTSVGDKVWNSSNENTWENSTMDTYLNGEWLTNFGHSDIIEDYDWHVGGHNAYQVTAKVMYDAEINSTPTVARKVGLMYASDYGYGALNNYWTTALDIYNSGAMNTDWIKLGTTEWTISRGLGRSTVAFGVGSAGYVDDYTVNYGRATRPVFFLKSSVVYKGGTGTVDNPIIIGPQTLSDHIIASYSGDGVGGLFLHDGVGTYTNASLEAGDNSYRYAGVDPNNYVCFGSDAETCPQDNLYRIIGVFDGNTKLIKADYADSNLLGTDGDFYKTEENISTSWAIPNYSGMYANKSLGLYYRNNSSYDSVTDGKYNLWKRSNLNKINLNTNYVNNIGTKWANAIIEYPWVDSGGPFIGLEANNNAKIAYNYEIASACESCAYKAILSTYNAKVGLMYVSEYMYGANPNDWNRPGYIEGNVSDYSLAATSNWLYLGMAEWLISSETNGDKAAAFRLAENGAINIGHVHAGAFVDYHGITFAIRPTFYLNPNVKYYDGAGTEADPIRIGI